MILDGKDVCVVEGGVAAPSGGTNVREQSQSGNTRAFRDMRCAHIGHGFVQERKSGLDGHAFHHGETDPEHSEGVGAKESAFSGHADHIILQIAEDP